LREAGIKETPVYVVKWTENKQSEFLIKDNTNFGEWDWDTLANEWDVLDLSNWGVDVPEPTMSNDERDEQIECECCGRQTTKSNA
jgi:hypothetical protein